MNHASAEDGESRSFRVRNRRKDTITLVLEPWATEYPMRPGDELEIRESGPEPDELLEIEIEASRVVIFGRGGTILWAVRDGQELP
jgi:hypothetical protein